MWDFVWDFFFRSFITAHTFFWEENYLEVWGVFFSGPERVEEKLIKEAFYDTGSP